MRTNKQQDDRYHDGIAYSLNEGTVGIPMLLLKCYGALGLTDTDVLFLIHLLAYREKEWNDCPSMDEMQERMGLSAEKLMVCMQRLIKRGCLEIEQQIDPQTGVYSERYLIEPLYTVIANYMNQQRKEQEKQRKLQQIEPKPAAPDVFLIFEREFARPLSPMECETISGWMDKDNYSLELITTALKEAVFNGKIHFRYIDRILLEWSRNRVYNAEQAKAFSQRFRGGAS